jgi:hypothetical protein
MKLYAMRTKATKTDHVTLGEARKAARAVKAKRVVSKSKGASSKQYQVLHERYLGEIVHAGGSSGSKGSGGRVSTGSGAARTPPKKK